MMNSGESEIRAILNTVSVSASRATFLAGFSYYQIGRYNFTGSDTSYIVFNTIAFVFSVLSAGISAFLGYYCPRSLYFEEDKRVDFVKKVIPYSRVGFQLYLLALISYAVGLCRMGFVYYPDYSDKYVPFVIFMIASVTIVIVIYGFVIRKYLELEEKLHGKEIVEERIAKILDSYQDSDQIEEKLKAQCDMIAGRALYIAGMSQTGILRYLPLQSPGTFSRLATAFLFFSCMATVTSLLSSSFLSVISIFINDAPTNKKRPISILLQPIAELCFKVYTSSFLFIAIMVTLMPYGCNYPSQSIFSILCGTVCFSSIIICIFFSNNAYLQSRVEQSSDSDIEKLVSERIIAQINNTGGQATLSSAFIFYNVVTQYTDVLQFNTQFNITSLWIFVNVFTVTTSLLSAIFDSIISFYSMILKSQHARFMFLQRTRNIQIFITVLFYTSLLNWFIIFGILGFTKYNVVSYIPVSFAVIFGIITLAGGIYLESVYSVVSFDLECKEDIDVQTKNQEKLSCKHSKDKANRLNMIAYKLLFLGGFAYNAAIFFQFQGLVFDPIYLSLMSATFCSSLTIISFAAFYNIQMYKCVSVKMQKEFSFATHNFYEVTCIMAAAVLVLLLCGYSLIGLIKNREYYTNWFETFPIMLASSIKILVTCVISFMSVRKHYLSSCKIREDEIINSEDVTNHVLDQIEVMACTASFVAGNVCYEILFTQTLSSRIVNLLYMALLNASFGFGVVTVAYSVQSNYFLGELDSEAQKLYFRSLLRNQKAKAFIISTCMLLTWVVSIILLGKVKYTNTHSGIQVQISMVLGILGTLLFLYFAFRIKRISSKYKDEEVINIIKNTIHEESRII